MRNPQITNVVVEDDPEWLLIAPEGIYREVDISVTQEQYERMWNGRVCAWCLEPWKEVWPSRCSLPGCWSPEEMSEEVQRAYLEERFGGEKWLGPSKATIASWETAASKIWTPEK